jgi:hypothetical protein
MKQKETNFIDWSASVPACIERVSANKPLEIKTSFDKHSYAASASLASGDACAPIRRTSAKFIPLLILALVCIACANQTILNSSEPKREPIPPSEQPKDSFERALRGVQSGDFTYIFVLRRKDSGAFGGEDSKFIRANTPPGTNQFVLTDEDKTIIIGSNFPFPPENLKALGERFNIEDYSKPEAKEANKNTNEAKELNKNTNNANK